MKIVIIGAGGFGREVLALIRSINAKSKRFDIAGFLDDGIEVGTTINGCSVLGAVDHVKQMNVEGAVVAIGNAQIRKQVVQDIGSSIQFPNIIHPNVLMLDVDRVRIGQGNIISAGNILTTDISIGDFCIVNLACTVGHDVRLSDFTSIMPGVNISGGAKLKEGVFVGTGAKLIKATTLGKNCIIGAGAVVDSDIPENMVAVGVPAKPIKSIHD